MKTDARRARTAGELRDLCTGWPRAVVRRAVTAVLPESDAAVVAAWLTDSAATEDAPPLPQDAVSEIVRQLHVQRQ